jgi:hypothetical protein
MCVNRRINVMMSHKFHSFVRYAVGSKKNRGGLKSYKI